MIQSDDYVENRMLGAEMVVRRGIGTLSGRWMDCVPEDKWKTQFTEIAGTEANGHHLPATSTMYEADRRRKCRDDEENNVAYRFCKTKGTSSKNCPIRINIVNHSNQ